MQDVAQHEDNHRLRPEPLEGISNKDFIEKKFDYDYPMVYFTHSSESFKQKPTLKDVKKMQESFKKLKRPNGVFEEQESIQNVTSLVRYLHWGYALKLCSWTNSTGVQDDVKNYKCNVLFFDYDEGILTEEDRAAFEEKANGIYHIVQRSSNWGVYEEKKGVKKNYRYHCFLILDETITDPELWKDIYENLMKQHAAQLGFTPDKACADWTRLCFAGKSDGIFVNHLPLQSVFAALAAVKEIEKVEVVKKSNNSNVIALPVQVDYELLKEVCHDIVRLNAHRDYDDWLYNLIFPLLNHHKKGFLTLEQLEELCTILDDGNEKWKEKIEHEMDKNPKKPKTIYSFASYLDNYGLGEKARKAFLIDDDEDIKTISYKQVLDFPMEIFPKEIREYGEAVAESLKTPIDFFATGVLGAASVLIGKQYQLWTKTDFAVYASIWLNIIAKSGVGKTPSQKKALKQIEKIEDIFEELYEQELQQYYDSLDDPDEEDRKMPQLEQMKASNATIEALKDLLEKRPVLLHVDESAGWIKSMGQYKKGASGEMEDFLMIADNTTLTVNRKDVRQRIKDPYMTFVGGTQPSKLEQLISMGLITNDGFMERFLVSFPNELPAVYNPIGADNKLEGVYNEYMSKLFDWNKTGGTLAVKLDGEAQALFNSYMEQNHAEINNHDFDGRLESYWKKTPSNLSKLTLIMHMIYVVSGDNAELTVNKHTVEASIKLMDYFKSHFAKMVRFALGSVLEKKYEVICGYITKHGGKITVRDLHISNKFGKSNEIRELLKELESIGLGRFTDNHKKKPSHFELFST
jgi:uncharacterized protein DUF3987